MRFWLLFVRWVVYGISLHSASPVLAIPPPPVQNKTTLILYTDTKTWNEAKLVCESLGQKLLDITYYSLYITVGSEALQSPWVDLPVGNGPPKWISLHRRITPMGDEFYSLGCQSLTDFNVRYWGGDTPYTPDGDRASFCVQHETRVDFVVGSGFSSKADYSMADCSEKHQFYCQKEEGPCPFEKLTDQHGDTGTDYTSGNDVVLPFDSEDACAERCFMESSLIESANDVTEECWGFTTTATECILHVVVKPSFFDDGNYYFSPGSNLFIKRCFYTDMNYDVYDVGQHGSVYPNTTCGTPVLENSTLPSVDVYVHPGIRTWNEALRICRASGHTMLDINSEDMYPSIQKLVAEYPGLTQSGLLWLGYHKPEPQNYTNIRIWSDCSMSAVPSNWDPDFPPSTSVFDVNLCVAINTTNFKWKTVPCNKNHSFVCVDETSAVGRHSFDSGVTNTVGTGKSLGPYNYSRSECGTACNDWAYQGEECRAFAYKYSTSEDHLCHLYFADNLTFYETNIETSPGNFTFYRKKLWTDHEVNIASLTTDDSILPYSCCDLSSVDTSTVCPSSQLPEYVPKPWNEASEVCKDGGGRLLRVDGVSKRLALQHYASNWKTKGHVFHLIWSGLILADAEDPCSYRWPHACTTPDWVVLQTEDDGTNTDCSGSCLCGALSPDFDHVMRHCNESLQFVCEYHTSDACAVDESLVDKNCFLEAQGDYSLESADTCNNLCLTSTSNNKECWTTVSIDSMSCAILFYLDPFYCRTNNANLPTRIANFKNCYIEEVEASGFTTSAETSQAPSSDCISSFVYPYSKDPGRCNTQTSSSSTSTATTTPELSTSNTPIPTASIIDNSASAGNIFSSLSSAPVLSPSTLPSSTLITSTSISTLFTTSAVMSFSSSTSPLAASSTESVDSTTSSVSTSFDTSFSSSSSTSSAAPTSAAPTLPPSVRSVPTSVQTVVPISVAASIVVPLTSLPQAVQSQNFTDPIFLWPCMCNTADQSKMTTEEWTVWLAKTESIAKYNTSKYKRKLACADDHRKSSASIGIVAVIVLVSFAAVIIILDAPTVVTNIFSIHSALKAKVYKPQKLLSSTESSRRN